MNFRLITPFSQVIRGKLSHWWAEIGSSLIAALIVAVILGVALVLITLASILILILVAVTFATALLLMLREKIRKPW